MSLAQVEWDLPDDDEDPFSMLDGLVDTAPPIDPT